MLDGLTVLVVEFVGAEKHFLVRLCRLESEFLLDFRRVEYEGACDHLVLVRAERRDAELACEFHARDNEPLGEMGELGLRLSAFNDVAVDFVECLYVVRTDVEYGCSLVVQRKFAGVRQVFRVNELVAVIAVADHPKLAVFVDKFEEDGKEAESSFVHDGGATENDGIQLVLAGEEDLFAFQFRLAVDFDGIRDFVFGDGVVEVLCPQAVRGGENELVYTVADAGISDDFGTVHVRCPQIIDALAVVGEHGGQVEYCVELVFAEKFFDLFLVADVTEDAYEIFVLIGIWAEVDTDTLVAFFKEFFLEDGSEESGAAGN